jgi:hypothetical protein
MLTGNRIIHDGVREDQMIEEALDNVDDLELLPESVRKLALARRQRPVLVEEAATPVQRAARRL